MPTLPAGLSRFTILTACFVLLAPRVSPRQEERSLADVEREALESGRVQSVSTVLMGRVLGPDGEPAAGAVVMTSAGGRTLTGERGNYRLAIEVPLDAESVEVTAVARATGAPLAASARVALGGAGTTFSGTLMLTEGDCCVPSWVPKFGEWPGVNGAVYGLTAFDDGSGLALYACGGFAVAGGVDAARIAKWDGTRWSALGGGLPSRALTLTSFDDGGGAALYAGGFFTSAGGVPANRVARWDGASWSALGSGLDAVVRALVQFDDGGGPALYAAGEFLNAGGAPANRIAKWDGSSWSALGSGLDGTVRALAVFDDGSGPALYAGGDFANAGGAPARRIAKWDGASWSALASGMSGGTQGASVHALASYDDGSGPMLVAAGHFGSAGGAAASHIARWDGTDWFALGSGLGGHDAGQGNALAVLDDGSGPVLIVGSSSTDVGEVARWDGTSWTSLDGLGNSVTVNALAILDAGSGLELHAGFAAGFGFNNVASWNGASWSELGGGLDSFDVQSIAFFDDGNGPALHAAGSGSVAGTEFEYGIAKWNGSEWSVPATNLSSRALALTVFDDGGGPALFVGGEFTTAGAQSLNRIARWDGTSWSSLAGGMNAAVEALAVFDDGSGPELFAAGHFNTAGGQGTPHVAKWNGTTWTNLFGGTNQDALALAVAKVGGGPPALYAGGAFNTAGQAQAYYVAKWDGTSWSALGSNFPVGIVHCLAAFDDGSGEALYVGGEFATVSGGMPANRIAKWDGTSWSALGSGLNSTPSVLAAFDDGSGPALYAGGDFTSAGGVAVNHIARWDGTSWSPVGSGMNAAVHALASSDDGSGPALFAGGAFTRALDSLDSHVAKWGCLDATAPVISAPTGVVVADERDGPPGASVSFTVTASDACDAAPSVLCVPPSGSFFPRGTTMVTCTATDASGNQATRSFPVSVALPPRIR